MNGAKQKTETLNLRVSPTVKAALFAAALKERRSMANMVECLVLAYCEAHGLTQECPPKSDETRQQSTCNNYEKI